MILIISLLISLSLGFSSVLLVCKSKPNLNLRLLLNLSIPISIGISSALFVFLNLLGIGIYFIVGLEFLLLFLMIWKTNVSEQIKSLNIFSVYKLFQQNIIYLILFAVYIYAWLMVLGIFYFDSIKEPHGLWDAWSYWNMKAKFICGAPSLWPSIISQMDSVTFHIDYPLMQSAFIAKCWIILGNESTWIPILSSFIFTFCTIGLLTSSVSAFTTRTKGLLAGLALLATPFFITLGDAQYADVTVGFFFLSTLVFLFLADTEQKNNRKFLIASGISISMAAWSKNEGLLFIICLIIARIIIKVKQPKLLIRELKYLIIGMLPILFLLAYFKIMIAPQNDLLQAQGGSTMEKIMDPERYKLIASWFYDRAGNFGEWIMNPWWIFLGAAIIFGVNNRNKTGYIVILLLLMLAGYFYSYVVSYIELVFHLSTSLHRLLFQLFPSFLFYYFVSIKELESSKPQDIF